VNNMPAVVIYVLYIIAERPKVEPDSLDYQSEVLTITPYRVTPVARRAVSSCLYNSSVRSTSSNV